MTRLRSIGLSAHTAYQDLLQAHRERPEAIFPGKPVLRRLKHGAYWYARRRLGGRIAETYLGPDTAELRARIEAAEGPAKSDAEFVARATSLVAQLGAAGLPRLDRETGKVLSALERVGAFRRGAVLVGTHAFRLYSLELGVHLAAVAAATVDLDVAAFAKVAAPDAQEEDAASAGALAEALQELGLSPRPGLEPGHSTQWRSADSALAVDFLTPLMKSRRPTVKLAPLGVEAQPLPFMEFLIPDPIWAVGLYRSGVLLRIPRPERFAVHKLIVAARRHLTAQAKRTKDLMQAEILIEALCEDRPGELREAYALARARGPAWRAALDASTDQDLRARLKG